MMDFKQWWELQEIFCGEGAMEAAEMAWDAAIELTEEHMHESHSEFEKYVGLRISEPDDILRTNYSKWRNNKAGRNI